jgi:hypothetical protein
MNTIYKLDSQFLYKKEQENLLLVSMSSDNNEIYKFSGLSSALLTELFESKRFSYHQAEQFLKNRNILEDSDLKDLWSFCLEEKIITAA